MKTKLNPHEAPKGYIAVRTNRRNCIGCAFHPATDCQDRPCLPSERNDRCLIHFVKETDAPKRPRPKATFARWRKDVGCPPVFAQLRIGGQVGNNLLVSMKNAEAYAERAWNAGCRAAGRRSRK